MIVSKKRITKALISLRGCAGWSVSLLFTKPRRQIFSRRGPLPVLFHVFFHLLIFIFFKIIVFEQFFQKYHKSVKQFGSRSGPNLGPNCFVCAVLFYLILYVPSTISQLNRDGSSWVEPVLR